MGELPCGSQPAAPKIGSMTKIVFPQDQHGYKLENMNLRRSHMHMLQLQILKLKDWYITTKYYRLDHNDYIRLKQKRITQQFTQ